MERSSEQLQQACQGRLSLSCRFRTMHRDNSKEFALELDELYEYWSQITDQSFDSRLQIFFDIAVVTVRKKHKEGLKEALVKRLDALTDKIGRNVVLQLVSTDMDPNDFDDDEQYRENPSSSSSSSSSLSRRASLVERKSLLPAVAASTRMSSALIRRLGIGRSRLRSRDFKNMSIFATIDKCKTVDRASKVFLEMLYNRHKRLTNDIA
ncbi:unnamed protein product [Camellia sinensis]